MDEMKDMDEILECEAHYGCGFWKDGFYFNTLYIQTHKGVRDALESGKIEGVSFKVTGHGTDIQPGDTYIAERSDGLKLLTCKKNDWDNGWITPVEMAYSYDTGECIRIELEV